MRHRTTRLLAISMLLLVSGLCIAAGDEQQLQTKLTGFQETPAILTNGKGDFAATLDPSGTSLSYSETFSGLSSPVTVSHIHIGQRSVAGGIMAFLCGGAGKPDCPAGGGTVTGTIMAADILAVPAQGVTAGSFTDFLRVIRSGNSYANVHTMTHPGGEVRGQISAEE